MKFEYANTKIVNVPEILFNQLQIAKDLIQKKSDNHQRISDILLDNAIEILLKNVLSNDLEIEISEREVFKMKFEDELVKTAFKNNKISNYQKFVFCVMHKTRNIFYHKGIPLHLEYALRIPDSINILTQIYFNLVCDAIHNLIKVLPVWSSHKKKNLKNISYGNFNKIKFQSIIGKELYIGLNIFLRFFAIKWCILTEMFGTVQGISINKNPDFVLKWKHFFKKDYKVEDSEKFWKDFENHKCKLKFKEFVSIRDKIIKTFKKIENKNSRFSENKIINTLINIDSLINKYENIIFELWEDAEAEIDRGITQLLEEG